jgi:thioredoxin reductase (NADPH)
MNALFKMVIGTALSISLITIFYSKRSNDHLFTQKTVTVDLARLAEAKNIIPVAVIGSGCAGLSAALYGARASLYTVVFQGSQPGGQLTTTSYVENWPGTPKSLGTTLINQTRKQAEQFGAVMVNQTIEKVDFSTWPFKLWTDDGSEINALSVIIATGSNPNLLKVPGESTYFGKGVTTCAICDAPYYKDKKVVIVGGGDSAVEEAVLLSSFAKEITVLVRGDRMRAAPTQQERFKQYPAIKILYNTQITEIKGNAKEVTHIALLNNKTKATSTIPVDGVFLAIGHAPNSQIFKNYLNLDTQGYITLAPRNQETNLQGIFAAGDVSDPDFKQAGVAAGDGIKAALGAVNFLRDHGFTDAFGKTLEKNYYESPDEKTPSLEIKSVTSVNDFEKLLKLHTVVVLDFYAPWCPSCMHLLPTVSSLAGQLKDKVHFVKVNIDDTDKLSKKYNVSSVPWLLVFKNGKEVGRTKEIMSKRKLREYITQLTH